MFLWATEIVQCWDHLLHNHENQRLDSNTHVTSPTHTYYPSSKRVTDRSWLASSLSEKKLNSKGRICFNWISRVLPNLKVFKLFVETSYLHTTSGMSVCVCVCVCVCVSLRWKSCDATQVGLKLSIFLSRSPLCWNYRHAPVYGIPLIYYKTSLDYF